MRTTLAPKFSLPDYDVVGTLRMEQMDGAFPIRLFKVIDKERFAVQYGCQLDYGLSYDEAAVKLGEASMHLLTCDGRLDP